MIRSNLQWFRKIDSAKFICIAAFVAIAVVASLLPFWTAERIAAPYLDRERLVGLGFAISAFYFVPFLIKSILLRLFFQSRISIRLPEFLLKFVHAFSKALDSSAMLIIPCFWFLPELKDLGILPITIPLTAFITLFLYRLFFRYRGLYYNCILTKLARAAYENPNNQLCLEQVRQLIIENKPFAAMRSLSSKLRLSLDEAENLLTHIAMDGEDHLFYLDREVAR